MRSARPWVLVVFAAASATLLACGREEAPAPPPPVGVAPAAQPVPAVAVGGLPSTEPRPGFRPVTVGSLRPTYEGWALTLVDASSARPVPMIIGEAEASVIQMRIEGRRFERPLTHDLLDTMLRRLGARVVMVEVDSVRGGAFVSNVVLWDGQELHRIDSRTSDAVAIALGNQAPIYAAQSVIDQTGVPAW